MEDHPLDGHTFGAPRTTTHLVDLWIRERRSPGHIRAMPATNAGQQRK
jgi:hypothetical protein